MRSTVEPPAQIGEFVRQARKALALTQPQPALAPGVGVRFIGRRSELTSMRLTDPAASS